MIVRGLGSRAPRRRLALAFALAPMLIIGCGTRSQVPNSDPVVPDGGPDAGGTACGGDGGAFQCAAPASTCIDDRTMRYFVAICTDAGACGSEAHELACDPSSTKPDCFQGGCRVVIVR